MSTMWSWKILEHKRDLLATVHPCLAQEPSSYHMTDFTGPFSQPEGPLTPMIGSSHGPRTRSSVASEQLPLKPSTVDSGEESILNQ